MKFLKYLIIGLIFLVAVGYAFKKKYNINPPIHLFSKNYEGDLPLDRIKLPRGFKIDVYAEGVNNARSLALSPTDILYVGNRSGDKVYALQDIDKDGRVDKKYTVYKDGNMPNGVAFKNGDLYIAEVNRVLRIKDIESNLYNPGDPEVIIDSYPSETHHGWKYIAFGPDGKLYVPVGAPCNVCDREEDIFNTITRINDDGSGLEIVQDGIRNTVGFTWHPETGELWFTDNGRDWMGDDVPACELNRAPEDGLHFGFPYCHQGDLLDDEFGKGKSCDDYVAPVQNLNAHVAPLGMEFGLSGVFPDQYKNQIFIAEHGSWNRSKKSGYQVSLVTLDENQNATSYEAFASGWLDVEEDDIWGRPVDLEWMSDGSLLISDDYANAIYRVYYTGQ